MRAGLATTATAVPELLNDLLPDMEETHDRWLQALMAKRRYFGITRIGSITRLDRIGVPVVQVVRPSSLSNAVSQGKGMTLTQAAASALMESIEAWAGENILRSRLHQPSMEEMSHVGSLYDSWLDDGDSKDWKQRPLPLIEGWNLFTDRKIPVPLALVDTVYTLPSPHPVIFPRTTTGMGAGRGLIQAVIHAGLEILERHARSEAHRLPAFFDRHQTSLPDADTGACADLLARIRAADLLCGLWQAPGPHDLPVYCCHLMERGPPNELVPLPSEGFGCDFTHEGAALKAMLEACQARATAISGTREDLTCRHYPADYDRAELAEWREQLSSPNHLRLFPQDVSAPQTRKAKLELVLEGLRRAGAQAAIVVPLYDDIEGQIHVARMLAPPLRLNPRA